MATQPTFVGVGGMKCASTWVSACLRDHPEVLLSEPKETSYFLTRTGLPDYMGYFGGIEDYREAGEFTPFYLPNAKLVSKRVHDTLGPVKILVTLRDPVRRYISHYKWILGRREDMPRERFSTLDLRNFERANSIEPRMLEYGHYRDDIEVYIERFGRERIHVMLFEDIRDEPLAEIQRVYAFLGVDDGFEPPSLRERVREGYVPRFELLERAKVQTYFVLKRCAPWSIDRLKQLRLEVLLRKINASKGAPLEVAPEVEDALRAHYRDEVEAMREFLGRELSQWG